MKFVIKDLTEDHYDTALGYMTNIFLRESGICGPLNIITDKKAREQMQKVWMSTMESKMAIICMTVDDTLPRVAGLHITVVKSRNSSLDKVSSPTFDSFATVLDEIKNAAQIFDNIGDDYYLGSRGLFVLPEFRNHGIATQLLRARVNMCKKLGLNATATVFSTPAAQAAAKSAGYEVFAEKTVGEIERKHGIRVQHNIKMMGKLVN